MLELRFLGGIEIARAGTPVVLPPSKKTRALLAFLAVSGKPHRRERICEMFWDLPDDPRGSLRWSLSKLRAVVDEAECPRIVADRDWVGFEAGGARIDVHEIKARYTASLEQAPIDGLKSAAAAFNGDFLEGLDLTSCPDFHAWCVAEREQLRDLQGRILSTLVHRLEATPDEAIGYGRALVRLRPLDDPARAQLVRLLVTAGHRLEAEQYYDSGKRAFAEAGLGEPSALDKAWREARTTKSATPSPAPTAASTMSRAIVQDIRFCVAPDGVQLAFATAGAGPPLVKTANWLNHLEFDWESPVWRHVLHALAHDFRLVRYDERGNGLSDWDVADISFEAFVRDLESVVDAAGLERFPLLGVSQGCAVSVAYALRHPERVSHLVLYGGYAKGWGKRDPGDVAVYEAMGTLIKHGWGQEGAAFRQMFTARYLPEGTPEQLRWHVELQRVSTSPENAYRIYQTLSTIDVRPLLSQLRVPTLVLHCRNDVGVPFSEGRELATGIPGARFVPLEGHNHLFLEDEPAFPRFLAELRAFLA